MKKIFVFIMSFILSMALFTACATGINKPIETDALAGFIEIRDNMLYITPVEVFAVYRRATANGISFAPLFPHSIEYIEINDIGRMTELGLSLDDFPSWYHIRPNWSAEKGWYYVGQANIETLVFELSEETTYTFVDFELLFTADADGDRQYKTNNVNEFLQYFYPTVVHFIEVYDGRVISLFQEFGFTL